MTDWLKLIAYTLVNILTPLVLALLPFRDSLRLRLRWIVLLSVILCALNATASWCSMRGASAAMLSVLSIFCYLGFYLAAVRAGPLKLLAVLLSIMNFSSLASVTARFLMLALAPELATQIYTWGYIGLYALGLLLPFPFYYRMLDKRIRPQVTAGNAEPFWRYLWAVPATFCAVYYYLLFSSGGLHVFSRSWENVLFLWAINAGALLVTNLVAHLLEEGRENLRLQQENSQLALQTAQFEGLQKSIEETRRARHDLRHHLDAMRGYLDGGDLEKLQAYIGVHTQRLTDISATRYSRNPMLDSILRYYANKLTALGADLTFKITVPELLPAAEPDVCVILGNLLENALKACEEAEKDAWVRVIVEAERQRLIIVVDNTAPTPPKQRDGQFLSSRHKGLGIGTQSVRDIAARYGGVSELKWENGIFYAAVMLSP